MIEAVKSIILDFQEVSFVTGVSRRLRIEMVAPLNNLVFHQETARI